MRIYKVIFLFLTTSLVTLLFIFYKPQVASASSGAYCATCRDCCDPIWGVCLDCSWTCFPAGTEITMSNSSKKDIEYVKIGEKVLSQSEQGVRSSSTVTAYDRPIRNHMCQIAFTNGNTLKLTSEHPLFSTTGWKAINPDNTAKENPMLPVTALKTGDQMIKEDGSLDEVLYFGCWSQRVQTYNLILGN